MKISTLDVSLGYTHNTRRMQETWCIISLNQLMALVQEKHHIETIISARNRHQRPVFHSSVLASVCSHCRALGSSLGGPGHGTKSLCRDLGETHPELGREREQVQLIPVERVMGQVSCSRHDSMG